jgi:hypothetical protein
LATRDHYVSQFHLREFTDSLSKGSPNPWLWVGYCKTREITRRSPKKIAWSRDLFQGRGLLEDPNGTLERFLAEEVEGPAAPALREFTAGDGIPTADLRPEVWQYLAWAAARGLPMKTLYDAWIDTLPGNKAEWRVIEPPPAGFPKPTEHGVIGRMVHPTRGMREKIPGVLFNSLWNEGWRPRLTGDEFQMMVHVSAWYFQARIFQRLKWLWARAPTGGHFVIGDRPVIWGYPGNFDAPPSAYRRADVLFIAPLSGSLALIGYNATGTTPETVFGSNLNRLVASAAHDWIAGPTEKAVRQALAERTYN